MKYRFAVNSCATVIKYKYSIYEFNYLKENGSDDESVRSSGEKTLGQELQGRSQLKYE